MAVKTKDPRLLLYRECTKFLEEIVDIVPSFPKEFKYTIGEKLQMLCVDMLVAISAADESLSNSATLSILNNFRYTYYVTRTLLRVAGDHKWIKGIKRYAMLAQLLDAIGTQSSVWREGVRGDIQRDTYLSQSQKVKTD